MFKVNIRNTRTWFEICSKLTIKIPERGHIKKNFMAPFYGWGSIASRLQSHYKEAVYFLPFSS